MWPFHKWKPPNSALTEDDFTSRGGFNLWTGFLDLRDRVGKIEGAMLILIPLVIGTFLIAVAQFFGFTP
jgi:hypothetical protein